MIGAKRSRGMRFAEVVARYAAQQRIGIHPAVVVERRDAARGVGIFVNHGCRAETPLIVVPAGECVTTAQLRAFGCSLTFTAPPLSMLEQFAPQGPSPSRVAALLDAPVADWLEFAWRVSWEAAAHRSRWWGWLASAPRSYDEDIERAMQQARAECDAALIAAVAEGRRAIEDEIVLWFEVLQRENAAPPMRVWRWAVLTLLSRSHAIPTPNQLGLMLGIVPIIDCANFSDCDSGDGRPAANAEVELLEPSAEPQWMTEALADSVAGAHTVAASSTYLLALTATDELRAGEEVCTMPPLSASSGVPARLRRLLRYNF